MRERLRSILGLIDEREEVYFLVLLLILTWAFLVAERLDGVEYIAGIGSLYGLLIAGSTGRAFAGRDSDEHRR